MSLQVTSTLISGQLAINMAMASEETVAEPIFFSPLDLTGYSIKMQVEFATPLLLSTGNGGISFIDAAGGKIQINIPSATSAGFVPGSYPYEFWLISPSNLANRLWIGSFVVSGSFTVIP